MKRFFMVVLGTIFVFTQLYADKITLKNGNVLEGKILSEAKDSYFIRLTSGITMVIEKEKVKSIEKTADKKTRLLKQQQELDEHLKRIREKQQEIDKAADELEMKKIKVANQLVDLAKEYSRMPGMKAQVKKIRQQIQNLGLKKSVLFNVLEELPDTGKKEADTGEARPVISRDEAIYKLGLFSQDWFTMYSSRKSLIRPALPERGEFVKLQKENDTVLRSKLHTGMEKKVAELGRKYVDLHKEIGQAIEKARTGRLDDKKEAENLKSDLNGLGKKLLGAYAEALNEVKTTLAEVKRRVEYSKAMPNKPGTFEGKVKKDAGILEGVFKNHVNRPATFLLKIKMTGARDKEKSRSFKLHEIPAGGEKEIRMKIPDKMKWKAKVQLISAPALDIDDVPAEKAGN